MTTLEQEISMTDEVAKPFAEKCMSIIFPQCHDNLAFEAFTDKLGESIDLKISEWEKPKVVGTEKCS